MGKNLATVQRIAFIRNGDSCLKKGAEETTKHLRASIAAHEAQGQLHTIRTRCTSQCEHGPVVFIHPEGTWYKEVSPETAPLLVVQHLLAGQPVREAVFYQSGVPVSPDVLS